MKSNRKTPTRVHPGKKNQKPQQMFTPAAEIEKPPQNITPAANIEGPQQQHKLMQNRKIQSTKTIEESQQEFNRQQKFKNPSRSVRQQQNMEKPEQLGNTIKLMGSRKKIEKFYFFNQRHISGSFKWIRDLRLSSVCCRKNSKSQTVEIKKMMKMNQKLKFEKKEARNRKPKRFTVEICV